MRLKINVGPLIDELPPETGASLRLGGGRASGLAFVARFDSMSAVALSVVRMPISRTDLGAGHLCSPRVAAESAQKLGSEKFSWTGVSYWQARWDLLEMAQAYGLPIVEVPPNGAGVRGRPRWIDHG